MSKLQFGRCNGIVKRCHHSSDNGSIRGPYCCIYISLAFEAHNKGWRATHSSPTNSPKWGNTASPASRAWQPWWQWAPSVCRRPDPRNSAVQINCAPQQPLQMNGYAHWAVENPRRMTRRSPFQEGEGGVHWGNPLQLQNNQLEEGFPLDHPSDHHVLLQQDQTWGN